LPGDWAPDLLYAILSSPNPDAQDALKRAAFAAGPALVPKLESALADDRTAEFAAQALGFIGGPKALDLLWKLQQDKRDLNLRRFYYGALGEYDSPQATDVLFDVINRSDAEPDRTVTEAAIIALTVRSDLSIVARLREAHKKLQDVVIRDDLDNAVAVIESRAKYLASPEGKKTGVSLEQAVRNYFMPALEAAKGADASESHPARGPSAPQGKPANAQGPAHPPAKPAKSPEPQEPPVKVEIRNLTFIPDKARALARVILEDPSATAQYDIVLQKQLGDWTVASVWLGTETEKPEPTLPRPAPQK
jgi:hypothetical protein